MSGAGQDPAATVQTTAPLGADAANEQFAFTEANLAYARKVLTKYPQGREASACKDLLRLAQKQCGGWLPVPAMEYVAEFLGMPYIRVYENASFYDMFNLHPVGETQIRVCTTTPCMLCGSDDIVRAAEDALGIRVGQSTKDRRFYLREFECLGACANAPLMWIDDDFYEDLDYASAKAIVEALKRGERPQPGSAKGRRASMPLGGKTVLHTIEADEPDSSVSGHAPVVPDPGMATGVDGSGGGSGQAPEGVVPDAAMAPIGGTETEGVAHGGGDTQHDTVGDNAGTGNAMPQPDENHDRDEGQR